MKKALLLLALATSTGLQAQIGFHENTVDGESFTTRSPQLVRAADIDGDGDRDIVTFGRQLNWYKNMDGAGNFGPRNSVNTESGGNLGTALYVADLDGDGDQDLIGAIANTVTLYRNTDGNGNFAVMQTFTLGLSYVDAQVVPADMDADGDLDLVCFYVINNGPFQARIVWFQNNGTGSFGTENVMANNSSDLIGGSKLAVADLDNDNDRDVVMAYNSSQKIARFKNNGNNVLGAPTTISSNAVGVTSVTLSDLDNDGDMDLVSTLSTGNQVVSYLNGGTGNFGSVNILYSSATATQTASVSDLNNDGLQDVIYTGTNAIGWLANLGSGTFGPAQLLTDKVYGVRGVITADLDGDGKQDLVSASQDDDKVAWYKKLDDSPSFDRQLVISRRMAYARSVYPGDYDGDGDLDLLVNSHYDSRLIWLENVDGNGFYGKDHIISEDNTPTNNMSPIPYPVDLDADGDLDIAVIEYGRLFWRENDGDGNFSETHLINLETAATLIRAADLDGDGDMDLMLGQYNSDKISWYANVGGGTFGEEQVIFDTFGNNGSLTSLEIQDMDGDGDQDFIVSSYNAYVRYYENTDGAGNFESQYQPVFFGGMQSVAPADLDGDGDQDIAGVSANGGGGFDAVVWYENTGGANFTVKHNVSTLSIHGQWLRVADLDNDGDLDVLTAAGHPSLTAQLAWYRNGGNGVFGPRQMIQELNNNTRAVYVNVADVDNDDDLDVLAVFGIDGNNNKTKVSVFENLGFGNVITGKVRIDTDVNGCSDTDVKGSNVMVLSGNASYSFATFTDANGNYSMTTGPGDYYTSIASQLPTYFTSDPLYHLIQFSGNEDAQAADFCVLPSEAATDLDVAVYPSWGSPIPGFQTTYRIVYRNKGNTICDGTVNLQYNVAQVNYVSSNQPLASQSPGSLSYGFTGLLPFETRYVDLVFEVMPPPAVNINDAINYTATVNTAAADQTATDNTYVLHQQAIGSYDPNDITCLEGDEVPIQDYDKYLHYIIRFQNTGVSEAINVKLKNEIGDKLDWATMKLESMSHPCKVKISGGVATFSFDNINLPASVTDEPHSHGFIAYKVKPLSDVIVGDIANNKAGIYFDFNPVVNTNVAATEFVTALALPATVKDAWSVYPNPVSDRLVINSPAPIQQISVIDLNGRVLQTFRFDSNSNTVRVDLSGLQTGIYFIQTETTTAGASMAKILKK